MQKKEFNVLGLAGLLTGIVAILSSCFLIGGFFGIIGLVASIIGLTKINSDKGTSITGLVLNIIAICFTLFWFVLILFTGDSTESTTQSTETINEYYNQTAESNSEIKTQESETQIIEENTIDCTISKCHVKYLKHEFIVDRSDKDCIVIYYEFTNNSKEKQIFSHVVDDMAFQNGVELERSIWKIDDEEDNDYLEIKPGATIIVYSTFVLRNDSPVEIELEEWISFDDKVWDTMIIEVE